MITRSSGQNDSSENTQHFYMVNLDMNNDYNDTNFLCQKKNIKLCHVDDKSQTLQSLNG